MKTLNTMKISIPETPVLTQVFQVSGEPMQVKYSIDLCNDDVWHEDTTVAIYSVNGVTGSIKRSTREEIDMLIREHAANVLNEFGFDKGCGHDEYLSSLMD